MAHPETAPYLSVLMPAYNEARNITAALQAISQTLTALACPFELIVIDDGSTDQTVARVQAVMASTPEVRLVAHATNLGPGSGISTGVKQARGTFVMFIPADLAMDITALARYLEASRDADVVVGLRSDRRDYTWFRKLVSVVNIALIKLLFGMRQRQFNYISLYRREIFNTFTIESRSVFVTAEIMIKARDRGFRLVEIEVPYVPREHGQAAGASLRSILRTVRDLLGFWLRWVSKKLTCRPLVLPVLALVALNMVAHFVPFERAALAPDDYAVAWIVHQRPLPDLVVTALTMPERPLNYLVVFLQNAAFGLTPTWGLAGVVLFSTLLLMMVYLVLLELLGRPVMAFLGASLYLLLPNKLELYHTSIYANMNLVFSVYLVALLCGIRFIRAGRRGLLMGSLLTYTIGIFWYEVGFFLPVVLAAFAWLSHRERLKTVGWFLIPMVLYGLFRLTGSFGFSEQGGAHPINTPGILSNAMVMAPHHYLGRYMLRAIVYGLYNFPAVERPWLIAAVLLDLAVLIGWIAWIRTVPRPTLDRKVLALSGLMVVAFLLPSVLYTVESRHTALASVGFVVLCLALLGLMHRYWRTLVTVLAMGGLVVSQGTGWIQVVACRVNRAVFDSLQEQQAELSRAERVLIDTQSFAQRIPYTWGERQGNRLNAYYGMQAFAPWGLTSMALLVVGQEKPVYIGRSTPEVSEQQLTFEVQVDGPIHRRETIPKAGTLVVSYDTVYGQGFRHGNRGT